MKKENFYLGTSDDNALVRYLRILFGIVCIIIAAFWIFYSFRTNTSRVTNWITVIFLIGFGVFQVLSGLGYTKIFIEIDTESILLKKNPVLPQQKIKSADLERIELFPLNLVFFLRNGHRIVLRFGTTYPQIIDDVKDAIILFAEKNIIQLVINEEELGL